MNTKKFINFAVWFIACVLFALACSCEIDVWKTCLGIHDSNWLYCMRVLGK